MIALSIYKVVGQCVQ